MGADVKIQVSHPNTLCYDKQKEGSVCSTDTALPLNCNLLIKNINKYIELISKNQIWQISRLQALTIEVTPRN